MKSYLEAFKKLDSKRKNLVTLTADCMLVEIIKDEDLQKTRSGIILADNSKAQIGGVYSDKPTFARVLMVGEGYFDDTTKADVPLDSKVGDIVLAGKHSFKRFSMFGKLAASSDVEICLMRDSDVQMRFNGEDSFNKVFAILESCL